MSARDATIVDVDGRWILHWPEGQRTTECTEELIRQVVDDHNAQAAGLAGLREQLARQAPVIEAAERVAWDYQHADEEDAEPDLSWCPYNRRGLPGADPDGICGFGCREEPACQTSGPWPMNELEIAVRALSVPAPPEQIDNHVRLLAGVLVIGGCDHDYRACAECCRRIGASVPAPPEAPEVTG